jgi:hypothetical protein
MNPGHTVQNGANCPSLYLGIDSYMGSTLVQHAHDESPFRDSHAAAYHDTTSKRMAVGGTRTRIPFEVCRIEKYVIAIATYAY